MKTIVSMAALLFAVTSVNAKAYSTILSVKDGGGSSGSHGFTTDLKGGEGNMPFKLISSYFEGTRGGIKQESGAGASGWFSSN